VGALVTPEVAVAGRCRVCTGPTGLGYSMCTSCRDVAVALGRPPIPVTPVALVAESSPLYRALRQYKSGEHEVAARQRARLAAFLQRFFARHQRCIAPHGADLSVVVPSQRNGRPAPHPLAALVAAAGTLPPVADVLAPGDAPIVHRRPSAAAYRVTAEVAGMRVLLVDDVYTSGAHLQSAAVALADAGAHDVRALVLGRFVRERSPRLMCARCQR
jgi:phosphoribosylpyrophosphate synthetase